MKRSIITKTLVAAIAVAGAVPLTATVALEGSTLAAGGAAADVVVCETGDAWYALDSDAVGAREVGSVDLTRRFARIDPGAVAIPFDGKRHARFQTLLRRHGDPAHVRIKDAVATAVRTGQPPDRPAPGPGVS